MRIVTFDLYSHQFINADNKLIAGSLINFPLRDHRRWFAMLDENVFRQLEHDDRGYPDDDVPRRRVDDR